MLVRLSIVRILVVLALLAVLSLVSWEFGLDAAPDILDHIDNSTLGFQKILVVSLPERTDRRDRVTLQAALTDLSFSFVDGVHGDGVPDKALPRGHNRPANAYIGSWRGHMDAIQQIVRDNLTSALILEDDVDWDIRLRPQLRNLARSTQSLIQPVAHTHHFADPSFRSPESDALPSDMHLDALPVVTPPRDSPYGDGWDLLWLGHCGMQFPTSVGRGASPRGRVVQLDDPTCPERRHLFSLAPEPFLLRDQYPDRTRVVHHARGGSCTLAYAVSQHGARALLHRVGLLDSSSGGKTAQDTPDPYDLRVRAFCDGPSDPSAPNPPRSLCLTVQPPLFNHHRPAGPKTALSDVYDYGAGDVERDASDMIRWSTRLNADVLIRGGDVYRDGLPDADPDEVGDDIM